MGKEWFPPSLVRQGQDSGTGVLLVERWSSDDDGLMVPSAKDLVRGEAGTLLWVNRSINYLEAAGWKAIYPSIKGPPVMSLSNKMESCEAKPMRRWR